MRQIISIFLTLCLLTSCNYSSDNKNLQKDTTTNIQQAVSKIDSPNFEKTEIICDTVFKSKKYKFTLTSFDTTSNDPDLPNTFFTFERFKNGKYETVFSDTIYCERQGIHFETFSKNNIKSILVQNNEDIRNNWTFNLYLVDTANDKLKKVKGFEEIKNPNYLPKYNLIDNYVISGKAWTSFYKIQMDTVKHFDIVVYDDHTENSSYDKDYKKAINVVLKKTKNNSQH
jgi:hypothetical protein